MKATVLNWAARAYRNKHTSGSAVILFAATVVGILWPQHKDKADDIARAAIVYGLVTAGDSGALPKPEPEVKP